jgi:hypothetical protein
MESKKKRTIGSELSTKSQLTRKDNVKWRTLSRATLFRQSLFVGGDELVNDTFLNWRIDFRIALCDHVQRKGVVAIREAGRFRRTGQDVIHNEGTVVNIASTGDCLMQNSGSDVIIHGHWVQSDPWLFHEKTIDLFPLIRSTKLKDVSHFLQTHKGRTGSSAFQGTHGENKNFAGRCDYEKKNYGGKA